MKYAQDAHRFSHNGVRRNVRRPVYDKFTSATHAASATAFGMADQLFHLQSDAIVDSHGCPWVVGLDVLEDRNAILNRINGPLQLHALPAPFRKAIALRLLN